MAPSNYINISLAPLAGNRINITVEYNATVLRLKQLFEQKEDLPPEIVKLYFGDNQLIDHQLLNEIGIVNGSIIHFKIFLQNYNFAANTIITQSIIPQQ